MLKCVACAFGASLLDVRCGGAGQYYQLPHSSSDFMPCRDKPHLARIGVLQSIIHGREIGNVVRRSFTTILYSSWKSEIPVLHTFRVLYNSSQDSVCLLSRSCTSVPIGSHVAERQFKQVIIARNLRSGAIANIVLIHYLCTPSTSLRMGSSPPPEE